MEENDNSKTERVKKLIEVSNLTKKYGKHDAVKNLSFRVEKGQIYGFLGPNGAGKSTTMNILTGYLCATEGTVTVNGYDVFLEPEKAKAHIGYLPELPPLYQDMTILEYLKFVAELKKIPKSNRAAMISEVMNMTEITDVSNRLIRNLSKGYRQRIGLAQAILGYPEIIILDEPTVGLDPKQIIEIRDLIKKLGENHTIILSSHILSEVSAVCDQIMIMSKGCLVANDTPENLSKILSGNDTLTLQVRGTVKAIINALSNTIDENLISISEQENSPYCKVSITLTALANDGVSDTQQDIRESIAHALYKADLLIVDMQTIHASLEDVFLELTKEVSENDSCL